MLIKILIKIPLLKKLITSLGIRLLKLFKKNRGYFSIKNLRMFLDFLDPIDREIILYQEYENSELNFLIKKIKENQIKDQNYEIFRCSYSLLIGLITGHFNYSNMKTGLMSFYRKPDIFDPNIHILMSYFQL